MSREEYISQWYILFTNYVSATLGVIAEKDVQQGINNGERMASLKVFLEGTDVLSVQTDLSHGVVTDNTLDKTAKIYAEIVKFFIDITPIAEREKECLKLLADVFENYRKEMTRLELGYLTTKIDKAHGNNITD